MIEMSFDGSDERVMFWLRSSGQGITRALLREMEVQMIKMRDVVVENKLSGQVLRNRTGTLRRSQHSSVTSTETEIIGKVATDPAASKYGRVHEYGGVVSVRSYLRRTKHSMGTNVRAHTATYPVRSFLRSTLMERAPTILEALRRAAAEAAAEANG